MKKCKFCQSEIDDKATVCPNCRRNQPINLNAGGVILVLLLIIVPAIYISNTINSDRKKQEEYESDYSKYSELNLLDVVNAKSENLSNAVSKYEGNTYIYNAEVYSIGESSFTVIVYKDDIGYEFDVYYPKSQEDKVNNLREGKTVKFYGKLDDLNPFFGYADIENAVIISVN